MDGRKKNLLLGILILAVLAGCVVWACFNTTVLSILIAVVMFGFLIFIHELGHFLAARNAGIHVIDFSLGMGPKIWSRQGKETSFTLRLFPIGGSCQMLGEDEDCDDERAFNKKGKWARFSVLVSGALMNILAGVVFLFLCQCMQPAIQTTTIDKIYLTEQTAFQEGDKILSLDGYRTFNSIDLNFAIQNISKETYSAVVERDGARVELKDIPLVKVTDEDGATRYRLGIQAGVSENNVGLVFSETATRSLSIVRLVWKSLIYLVTGRAGIADLSGPVGITVMIGQTVQYGLDQVLWIAALIAINLGVVNLLPLPALDGGRIFFLLIEAVRGKPVPPEKEGVVHLIGFALLMLLTVVIFIKDIIGVFAG